MITRRYTRSVEPVFTDGRDIDTDIGQLIGEGAQQKASGAIEKHLGEEALTWRKVPEARDADPTYYDRPLLQRSVWTWAVPTYYYVGGLSGASLVLAAALQLRGGKEVESLTQRCRAIGLAGTALSGALLIYDLGRPGRFLNMLRVFRPTSPMNMGAWILSGTGGASFAAVLCGTVSGNAGQDSVVGLTGELFGYLAGIFGLGLATYPGVLTANTAVPLWQASRKVLPILFGAAAMTSVGCTFDLFCENDQQRRITSSFGNIGRIAELAAGIFLEQQASVVPRVARPLRRGLTGLVWRTSEILIASSLIVSMMPKQNRRRRIAAGVLGTIGSLLLRFGIEHAGNASARDPRASFHQQRSGRGAAEVTGRRSSSV